MKKISTIVVALFLVFAMSQCKKNEQNASDNQGETVTITLDVNGASTGSATGGSRVIVNPATGTVDFENGDQIIVASGGKYVGTLTYNGNLFTGAISNATEGYPLQFYFLGNVTPVETLTSGITESCSVVISDQTEHLPVISAAPSDENYAASTTNYTAHLLNKCALVKFNVTTASESAIYVTGFNNKVTVNFMENTLTNSQEGNGVITLPAGNGEKWAILLPQNAIEIGETRSAYSGNFIGTRGAVPVITENGYLTVGVDVIVNTPIPTGSINGWFTINADGDKVYFSKGNLQYQASTNSWRFAENQWNYVGGTDPHGNQFGNVINSDNAYISETYEGWIDLFGWGTSGYNHGANSYQPWSTSTANSDYYAYGNYNYNLFDQTGQADWGYNPISNGSNTTNQWRTLTHAEWDYIFNTRNTISGIRYVKAKVNNVKGIILLPDDWNVSACNNTNNSDSSFNSNILTVSEWLILEQMGAIFLPAAGVRTYATNNWGMYWSATSCNSIYIYVVTFLDDYLYTYSNGCDRCWGISVRLVCDVE